MIGLYCSWHFWERGFFWKMSSLSFLFEAASSCSRDTCTLPAPSTVQWFVTHFKSWSRISANAAIILKAFKKKREFRSIGEERAEKHLKHFSLSSCLQLSFSHFQKSFPSHTIFPPPSFSPSLLPSLLLFNTDKHTLIYSSISPHLLPSAPIVVSSCVFFRSWVDGS